ncbi:MAG: hypothetical protein AAF297_03480 [Planctomycetota bacterium]
MTEVDSGCKYGQFGGAHEGPPLDPAGALDALAAGIAHAENAAREEHAPTGPDALHERDLHAVLAEGLASAGHTVLTEVHYPHDPGGTVLPRDRERCDLVALPAGSASVFDPVADRAERDAGADTLFAAEVDRLATTHRPHDACDPADAAWIEIKTTGTYAYRDGVPGPNRAYADELLRGALADGLKLAEATDLGHRWFVAVVFTAEPDAIDRDLVTVAHAMLDHGIDTRAPLTRRVPISDRAGNTHAVLALYELSGPAP